MAEYAWVTTVGARWTKMEADHNARWAKLAKMDGPGYTIMDRIEAKMDLQRHYFSRSSSHGDVNSTKETLRRPFQSHISSMAKYEIKAACTRIIDLLQEEIDASKSSTVALPALDEFIPSTEQIKTPSTNDEFMHLPNPIIDTTTSPNISKLKRLELTLESLPRKVPLNLNSVYGELNFQWQTPPQQPFQMLPRNKSSSSSRGFTIDNITSAPAQDGWVACMWDNPLLPPKPPDNVAVTTPALAPPYLSAYAENNARMVQETLSVIEVTNEIRQKDARDGYRFEPSPTPMGHTQSNSWASKTCRTSRVINPPFRNCLSVLGILSVLCDVMVLSIAANRKVDDFSITSDPTISELVQEITPCYFIAASTGIYYAYVPHFNVDPKPPDLYCCGVAAMRSSCRVADMIAVEEYGCWFESGYVVDNSENFSGAALGQSNSMLSRGFQSLGLYQSLIKLLKHEGFLELYKRNRVSVIQLVPYAAWFCMIFEKYERGFLNTCCSNHTKI